MFTDQKLNVCQQYLLPAEFAVSTCFTVKRQGRGRYSFRDSDRFFPWMALVSIVQILRAALRKGQGICEGRMWQLNVRGALVINGNEI